MTFTAMCPVEGLGDGRLIVEYSVSQMSGSNQGRVLLPAVSVASTRLASAADSVE